MTSTAASAGSSVMPSCLSRMGLGTSAVRLPMSAPVSPATALLPSLERSSANLGSSTCRSSADSGGAALGLSFA